MCTPPTCIHFRVRGTKQRDEVHKFLDWFGSAEFQVAYVKATNNDTPLNADALKELPEAAAAVNAVKKQDIDWAVVTPHLTEWLQKIQLEIAH